MSKRQMLSKIWCLASSGQLVHLYHLFCMKSNAIFHFYCSLYLLILGASVWSIALFCCQVYRVRSNLGSTIRNSSVWNTEMSKIMISYRLKYNRYRYFSSTGIPRIPTSGQSVFYRCLTTLSKLDPRGVLCWKDRLDYALILSSKM